MTLRVGWLLFLIAAWGALAGPATAQRPAPGVWEPQIAVVWPHDGKGNPAPVARATHVNVSIWPRNVVSCEGDSYPLLSMALDQELRPVSASVSRQLRTVDGVTFPTVEYNDVRVEPGMAHRFFVTPSPVGPNSNVWVHAQDTRTLHPNPEEPSGIIGDEAMSGLVAPQPRIRVVWPHDGQGNYTPVDRAEVVNIGVALLDMLDRSVEVGYEEPLMLFIARNNAPLQRSPIQGVPFPIGLHDGTFYPTWQFNDVPVSPTEQSHFVVLTGGGTYSAPWTHAVDGRTILPTPEVPPPCIPATER